MSRLIYVEGYPDAILVGKLGVSKKSIMRVGSKGRIATRLERLIGNKVDFLLGMVDEDPNDPNPSYFSTFEEVEEKHDIRVSVNYKNEQILVEILPRLEEWILKSAKASQIDMKKLRISTQIKEFKKLTSQKNVPKKFDDLIHALLTAKSTRLAYLREMLNADIEDLTNIT